MDKIEFVKLLNRYTEGIATEEEKQLFDRFFEQCQKEGEAYWFKWELSKSEKIKLGIYQSLNRRIDKEEKVGSKQKKKIMTSLLKVVASIIMIIGLGFLIHKEVSKKPAIHYITKTAERGERLTITLNDGTSIKLNSRSSITFPDVFQTGSREVSLKGEAFFEVKRDTANPFIVKTDQVYTTVLGTSFNIKAFEEEDIQVTVASGKVRVETSTTDGNNKRFLDTKILTPGEQAVFEKETANLTKREVSLERNLAWKSNIIYFDDTPLSEVVKILGNWFDLEIKLENEELGSCLISGKYKSDKLTNILESLRFLQGIEYDITGERQLLLSGKSCK
jgi:ferric-dicitrate binding protein FerR (iron transport regulator)